MSRNLLGIHHVTAIAGDPQANIDFYAGLLGLRLVKLTVNFDDPGTYHLYYGDGVGTPGTIVTFFPWPKAPRGRHGTGQVTETAFAVPSGSLPFWKNRLQAQNVAVGEPTRRMGEELLSFTDPDGLRVELIASESVDSSRAYTPGPIPIESAIHGLHSATLSEEGYQKTASLLTDTMGFKLVGQENNRFRYMVGSGAPGELVDIRCAPEEPRGSVLVGTVHHIAWRVADDEEQVDWLGEISSLGYNVSPVMDRKYFQSIYFREPGGILFEIATDAPGFAVDEPVDELGTQLVLPDWLEERRSEVQAALPVLHLPSEGQAVS